MRLGDAFVRGSKRAVLSVVMATRICQSRETKTNKNPRGRKRIARAGTPDVPVLERLRLEAC